MTQQTALSLSEYIASEKKRLDEFEAYYREQNSKDKDNIWPLIKTGSDWDEEYCHFFIGFQYEPQ